MSDDKKRTYTLLVPVIKFKENVSLFGNYSVCDYQSSEKMHIKLSIYSHFNIVHHIYL